MGNQIKNRKESSDSENFKKIETKDESKTENIEYSLWKDIRDYYKFGQVIGSGGFAEVRICKKKDDSSNKIFAVKSIYKPSIKQEKLNQLIQEIQLLTSLDHPNIIKFYESYQDEHYFHIIMEHCHGGELFERIINSKVGFKEYDVAQIIWSLMSAIYYCHSKGVIHRDIKPENILLEGLGEDYEGIKVIDFGLSKKFEENKKLSTILGTPYYMAPEVLKGCYNQKCDVWSIGIITYALFSGNLPFIDKDDNYITFQKIVNDEPSFEDVLWKKISPDAILFIKSCLNKDPEKRMSSKEALNNSWFLKQRNTNINESGLCPKALSNLRDFNHISSFKKIVIKSILSNFLSIEESKRMRKIFQAMDLDHTGYIHVSELSDAFSKSNIKISDDELKNIIKNCDDHKNGKLDYSEFLVGSLDPNYNS